MNQIGEISALATAICWTFSAMLFEASSKKVGSLAVNVIRMFFAIVYISVYTWINRGVVLPVDALPETWLWLSVSGLIGFVIGDFLLFDAFIILGSRVTMLIMTLVPPITATIGWLMMDEKLNWLNWLGMIITISGISLVVLGRKKGENKKLNIPLKGLLYAFGAAIGQAAGLVFSKFGMAGYPPFAATQIRIISGIAGFLLITFMFKKQKQVFSAMRNKNAMFIIMFGAFFGPFLGVSLSLLSVQYTTTGVASTIMAIVPVLIIPPSVIFLKQKITFREILGAVISVSGVALLFV